MNVQTVKQTQIDRYVFYRAGAWMLLLAAVMVLVSACAGAPKPVKVKGEIFAAETLNPDYQGRPSPVKIIVLQLTSADAFNNADFFSLFDAESGVLGDDELARTEMLLQPGETREWEPEFSPETEFVGVIGAFRDIENAQWRASAAVVERGITAKIMRKKNLKIAVDSLAVSVSTE